MPAAARNPRILRTCRTYLHHVQRSVFEGQLSDAQLRRGSTPLLRPSSTSPTTASSSTHLPTRHHPHPPCIGRNRACPHRCPLTLEPPIFSDTPAPNALPPDR